MAKASSEAGKPSPQSGSMSFVDKIKKSFLSPSELFNAAKSESGIKNAMIFQAIFSLILLILLFAIGMTALSAFAFLMPSLVPFLGLGGALGIAFVITAWVAIIAMNFVSAGIIHLFVLLVGGKKGYGSTYKAICYSIAPGALLGWIPLVNIAGGLYSLYLYVKGISILHEITMGRAFLAVLIPIVLVILIVVVFVVGMFSLGVFNPAAFAARTP